MTVEVMRSKVRSLREDFDQLMNLGDAKGARLQILHREMVISTLEICERLERVTWLMERTTEATERLTEAVERLAEAKT